MRARLRAISLWLAAVAAAAIVPSVAAPPQGDVGRGTARNNLSSIAPRIAAGPLARDDFEWAAPQGFDDRDNSQTWSMAWFNGALYVGTGRSTYCMQQATLELFQPFPDPYPPQDEDVVCPPDPHDIPLQAEIWRWRPSDESWTRVYQSPMDVPIQGTDKFTARDVGYRGMVVFPEQQPDGSTKGVLYVSGVSTRAAQGSGIDGPVPPPRILRSEDGVVFTPIPQDPGTFLGDTLVSGFRNLEIYHKKLYVLASVGLLGHGLIFESAEPWLGNDAFRQVSPPGVTFFEIQSYNGFLYAGTGGQPINGDPPFRLLKTDATGEPPYEFTEVIPEAAYRTSLKAAAVISMQVFKNRLYVGTDRELLRVNPDDTWDLLIGSPRDTPEGFKTPLGGINIGFDNLLNIHMWRLGVHDGWLYVGTQDQSTKWRNLLFVSLLLRPGSGFDLWATNDGWHFTRVDRAGFGDLFNNGVRNFASTPKGFFLGTANHYYGLQIYRAPESPPPVVPAPKLLELEVVDGHVLLSWEGSPSAVRYHIFRNAWFTQPHEIGSTDATTDFGRFFVDTQTDPSLKRHYVVEAEDASGHLSAPSNLGRLPSIGIVPTFSMIGGLLVAEGASPSLLSVFGVARSRFEAGDYDGSLLALRRVRTYLQRRDLTSIDRWRAEDLDVLVAKLYRRVELTRAGLIPPASVVGEDAP